MIMSEASNSTDNMPNFPDSVRNRYEPEELMHATSTTIYSIVGEIGLLNFQENAHKGGLLTAKLRTQDGKAVDIANMEKLRQVNNSRKKFSGMYSKFDRLPLMPESLPLVSISTKERLGMADEMPIAKNPHEQNDMSVTYWIYDRPTDNKSSYEPVIYESHKMIANSIHEHERLTGPEIDAEEFDLAMRSGNLHRLSEAEAKDLLHEIQTATPVGQSAEGEQ